MPYQMNPLYSRAMNPNSAGAASGAPEHPSVRLDEAHADIRAVDRAVSDLRRGLPVVVTGEPAGFAVAVAAEQVTDDLLEELRALGGSPPTLAITAERADVLHVPPSGRAITTLDIENRLDTSTIQTLADPTADLANPLRGPFALAETSLSFQVAAAVELCKFAKLLPAAVTSEFPGADEAQGAAFARDHDLLVVPAPAVLAYQSTTSNSLVKVASARVPLAGTENVEVIAFRPLDGGTEHLAIIVGEPSRRSSVLTRLHSECFTGDLLESLRCDCGTQLRAAVDTLTKEGGGILLYLAQEGRGIGLINKLRAYQLQDQGFDTYDANERLGFEADARIFEPAAQMLRLLGISRVRLLTNNPEKVSVLENCGIEVTERVAHAFPANPHNAHYLDAKAKKAGHHL